MRKQAIAIAACLAAGVCTSTLLAWCAAAFARMAPVSTSDFPMRHVAGVVPRTWGEPAFEMAASSGIGVDSWHATWTLFQITGESGLHGAESARAIGTLAKSPPDQSLRIVSIEGGRCGWPFRAHFWRSSSEGPVWSIRSRRAIRAADPNNEELPGIEPLMRVPWSNTAVRRAIPFAPIWLGLIGNTLVYAGVIGLVCVTISGARRSRRKRNRQCIACGYQLPDISVCPECGTSAQAASKIAKPRRSTPVSS